MKYILSFFGIGIICLAIFLCGGQKEQNVKIDDCIRIHVVANSNSSKDEEVKYFVKDVIMEYLNPFLEDVENDEEAKQVVFQQIPQMQKVANEALRETGVSYGAMISITKEDMPTRAYDNMVFEEGCYDSLKIELGNAGGDNWWCVVFPSVCFISEKNVENYVYISKIWEIIYRVTK